MPRSAYPQNDVRVLIVPAVYCVAHFPIPYFVAIYYNHPTHSGGVTGAKRCLTCDSSVILLPTERTTSAMPFRTCPFYFTARTTCPIHLRCPIPYYLPSLRCTLPVPCTPAFALPATTHHAMPHHALLLPFAAFVTFLTAFCARLRTCVSYLSFCILRLLAVVGLLFWFLCFAAFAGSWFGSFWFFMFLRACFCAAFVPFLRLRIYVPTTPD